jgi:hypothetical protein
VKFEPTPSWTRPAEPESGPEPASAWTQPTEAAPEPQLAPEPAPEPEPPITEPPIEAPPPYAEDESDAYDDENRSSFDYEPPFRPRRNKAKMWLLAAVLFAVVALAAVMAVGRYGLPDWVPLARPTFAQAQPELQLDFPPNRQDRRTLPNGTEYFGASGTVTNVGQSTQRVPTILIVLRDRRDRIVYSYEVAPPKQELAPGESVTINEAVTDVPKTATAAEIGWKPG